MTYSTSTQTRDPMARPNRPAPERQVWVKTRRQRQVPANVRSGGRNLSVGFTQNQEMYRVLVSHTHAYEEWHVEMVAEQRQARASGGLLNYDCHRCKATVLLAPDADRCPDGPHLLDEED